MRIVTKIGQILCGLSGHEYRRQWERTALRLVCIHCAHLSNGWQGIGTTPPPVVKQNRRQAFKRVFQGETA